MGKLYSDKKERNVFVLLLLYAATAFMFDADDSKLRFIYLTYGLLCLVIVLRTRAIVFCDEIYSLVGYFVFGLCSALWAADPDLATVRARGVLLLLFGLLLIYTYVTRIKKPQILVAAIVFGGLALSLYFISLYGFSGIMTALKEGGERLGGRINNVNAIGNSTAIAVVAAVGALLFSGKKLIFVLIAPMALTIFAAGSRTSILVALVGVFVLVQCYLKTEKSSSKKIMTFLGIILVFAIILSFASNFGAFNTLMERIENAVAIFSGGKSTLKENSAQTRLDYIQMGWEQFLKSPILGNGIGCAGYAMLSKYSHITYLHNNYLEILASGGVIGFVLYYTPYMLAFKAHTDRIRQMKDIDPIVCISFALLCARLVGHMGTVVYYSKTEYLLMALWFSVAHLMPEDNDSEKQEKGEVV